MTDIGKTCPGKDEWVWRKWWVSSGVGRFYNNFLQGKLVPARQLRNPFKEPSDNPISAVTELKEAGAELHTPVLPGLLCEILSQKKKTKQTHNMQRYIEQGWEKTQWLKALEAFPRTWGFSPNIHVRWLTSAYSPGSWEFVNISGLADRYQTSQQTS